MRTTTDPHTSDPEFADDYVVHQPSQYSVTRGVTSTGEVLYLLTFIDSMLVPVISGERHSAREQKLIRTTVQMSKSFFEHMVKTVESLEPRAATAVPAGTAKGQPHAGNG